MNQVALFEKQLSKYPHNLLSQLLSFEDMPDITRVHGLIVDFVTKLVGQYWYKLAEQLKSDLHYSPRGLDHTIPKEMQGRLRARMPTRSSKLIADLFILGGAFGEAINM